MASFVANPSLETAKEIIKESPVISAGVGLVVGGGAVKVVAPVVGGYLQSEAIQEQTKAIEKQTDIIGEWWRYFV